MEYSNAKKLELEQELLHKSIKEQAIKEGLMLENINNNIEPIYDGVADFNTYLESKPKIMLIVKEAYDNSHLDEEGKLIPSGGGWSLPEIFKMNAKDGKWPILTWQRVIYTVYGYLHNKDYREMDCIKDNPEMGKVLLGLCWINLNKMPGLPKSNNTIVRNNYMIHWKDIIRKQILTYDPDVIIFGGTLFKNDDFYYSFLTEDDWNNRDESVKDEDGNVFMTKYYKEGKLIIDAKHPGLRKKVDLWVNSIIDALKDNKNNIK